MMAVSSWKSKTLEQLRKDMVMAGVDLDDIGHDINEQKSLDDLIQAIGGIVATSRKQVEGWQNLNYRIDLPGTIPLNRMKDEEIARLYLLRSFQKVWLRAQFSGSTSKDADEPDQKHLKR